MSGKKKKKKSDQKKKKKLMCLSGWCHTHKVRDARSPPSMNFIKADIWPNIPPVTQILRLSPTPPSQLAPELHCFDYCAMQFLALSFSAQAHVLRRLHEHTSTLSPVAEHHVNPPLPVTAHCQQHRIRSVWLLCCLAMVAMETFFKGGLGQKRNVERNIERGKRR